MFINREKIKLVNVLIDNVSLPELLENLKTGVLFTPNVDHIIKLQKNPAFSEAYQIADYIICDSKILLLASKFLGTPIKEKISGSDFFPAFYEFHKNNDNITIFLLGAKEGVAREAQQKINAKVGRNMIVGSYSPPLGFEQDPEESAKIIDIVQKSGATVLAVGVGAPKQENWIYQHRDKLPNIKIFLAIGATIDFEAGHKPRAPKWMSNAGLEWLYRLLSEPQRLWKRYLIDSLPFLWLVLQQKLRQGRINNRVVRQVDALSSQDKKFI
jgi:exopolysaccharide biosynthesis WecB/TagA/CpsF family protein